MQIIADPSERTKSRITWKPDTSLPCYRIFAFELHANMPHVMRLALHLENQQSVVFSATADLEDILSKLKHTTLTGWFVANSKFPSARAITYTNFPDQFV